MSEAHIEMSEEKVKPFPPGVLWGAATLILFTITLAATARLTGNTLTDVNPSPPAKVLDLTFADRNDGAITVFDAKRQQVVDVLAPGTSGFVRNVMRSMARERRMHGQGADTPFQMTRWTDGRLTIDDPITGRHVDLGAFGSMNTASFARLMGPERTQ
jgi:putative photosynthetic complex assembly protein